MNINEQLADLKNTVTGFFGSKEKELTGQVTELQGKLQKAEADSKKASEDATAANGKVADLEAKLKQKEEENAKLKGELETANKAKVDAEAKAKETEESVEARAKQKAIAIEQSRGATAPAKDEPAKDNPGSKESRSEGLTGMARLEAAFKAELGGKN